MSNRVSSLPHSSLPIIYDIIDVTCDIVNFSRSLKVQVGHYPSIQLAVKPRAAAVISHHAILLVPEKTCISFRPPQSTFHGGENTISPHTTACRYKPLRFSSVRNPSLPATSSRQSRVISSRTMLASLVCAVVRPNMIHFPILVLSSESHRGFREAVTGLLLAASVDEKRACRRTGVKVGLAMNRHRASRCRIMSKQPQHVSSTGMLC
jgi:hypothetical protein